MTHVIALLERDEDPQVVAASETLAALLGVGTSQLQLLAGHTAEQVSRLLGELSGPDVAAVVLSAGTSGAVCWQLLPSITRPALVIPARCDRSLHRIERVLLPLDGAETKVSAVARIARLALEVGAEVRAVHVFNQNTVPAFWDQSAHAHRQWTREFLARNLPDAVTLDLRRGRPVEEVLAEAGHLQVDLIVLAWSKDLGEGRASVVRGALELGTVPVLLVDAQTGSE